MRVFVLIEWTLIGVFIWLVANILRYLFFKRHGGGLFFWLSDKWIGRDKEGGR